MKGIFFTIVFLIYACTNLFAQNTVTVRGVIVDESGEPMVYAPVIVYGIPGIGALTGMNGEFEIEVKTSDVLLVSFIGCKAQKIPVSGITGRLELILMPEDSSVPTQMTVLKNTQDVIYVVNGNRLNDGDSTFISKLQSMKMLKEDAERKPYLKNQDDNEKK